MLFNLKYCGDCIRAGIDCFPKIDGNKPIRDTFCEKAYTIAMSVFYRRGNACIIPKEQKIGAESNHC